MKSGADRTQGPSSHANGTSNGGAARSPTLEELLGGRLTVLPALLGTTKEDILREIAGSLCSGRPIDAAHIHQVLKDREGIGTTAMFEGAAVPHGRHAGIEGVIACLARSPSGVDFAARDGKPTHVFLALLAPEEDPKQHLKVLARVSRLFSRPGLIRKVVDAPGAAEMVRIVFEGDTAP
ncbi:MAG: PTS sugar transporter subunit IIA [Bdellovibrionota bacterium]